MAGTLFDSQIFTDAIIVFTRSWAFWAPPLLAVVFWETWVGYARAYFMAKTKWVLLEISIPRDVAKSPKAMESILAGIHGTSRTGNAYERYWVGWLTAWFSLEIVGDATGVHFYVWTQEFFRRMVESQIYAQYPSCEIRSVEDYTKQDPGAMPTSEWSMWGSEYILTKPDAYPIKTYEEFDLVDISSKEEEMKIDPLAALVEFFGSFRNTERIWLQIIVRPAGDSWQKEGAAIVAKLLGKKEPPRTTLIGKFIDLVNAIFAVIFGAEASEKKKEDALFAPMFRLSPGETETLKALERNMTKIGFEVGIRWIYLSKKQDFNMLAVPAVNGIFKQFASPSLNGFKLNKNVSSSVDYVFKKTREYKRKKRIYNAFRMRSFFHPPYRGKPMVLSSSELATIYHFPGMVVGAPSMERIEAKKGASPPNLPI